MNRQEEYGLNVLPEKQKESELIKFLKELTSLFSILLWVACGLALFGFSLSPKDTSNVFISKLKKLYIAFIISTIVLITAFISYYQKSTNQRIIDKLKSYSESTVKVIRESVDEKKNKFLVRVSDLVPGDVIEIKQGQRIHADIRIMKAVNFKIDNSSFTVIKYFYKGGVKSSFYWEKVWRRRKNFTFRCKKYCILWDFCKRRNR